MLSNLNELIRLCKSKSPVYIYGAGINAKRITSFLKENGIILNGYIVSDMNNNPESLFGLTVVSVLNFWNNRSDTWDGLILVSIGRSSDVYLPVFETIVKYRLKNVVFLPNDFLEIIRIAEIEKRAEERLKKIEAALTKSNYYLEKNVPVERNHFVLALSDQDGRAYHWRVRNRAEEKEACLNALNWFPKKTALEEFQERYGKYYVLNSLKEEVSSKEISCSIYMAHTHKDEETTQICLSPWIIPIQVGADLTDQQISQVRDNQGDNISDRNGIYSECTALYWMWKHALRTDYIGLCHYRRHFDMTEEDLKRLEKNDIDALVTSPTFVYEGIGNFFSTLTPSADLEMLVKAIDEEQPEYLDTTQTFLKSRFFPPCNLSLMKYDLFQEYARFVFSVTFKIEEFYDNMGFFRRDRYMGYLVECLLGIFLMHNKDRLKIAYTDMIFYS